MVASTRNQLGRTSSFHHVCGQEENSEIRVFGERAKCSKEAEDGGGWHVRCNREHSRPHLAVLDDQVEPQCVAINAWQWCFPSDTISQ
jgi:hypothetical protein